MECQSLNSGDIGLTACGADLGRPFLLEIVRACPKRLTLPLGRRRIAVPNIGLNQTAKNSRRLSIRKGGREMKKIISGNAPCGKCGKEIDNIPLVASSKEPDGAGGYNYKVNGKAACLNCGEPLVWFHQPAPPDLAKELFSVSYKTGGVESCAAQLSVQPTGKTGGSSEC